MLDRARSLSAAQTRRQYVFGELGSGGHCHDAAQRISSWDSTAATRSRGLFRASDKDLPRSNPSPASQTSMSRRSRTWSRASRSTRVTPCSSCPVASILARLLLCRSRFAACGDPRDSRYSSLSSSSGSSLGSGKGRNANSPPTSSRSNTTSGSSSTTRTWSKTRGPMGTVEQDDCATSCQGVAFLNSSICASMCSACGSATRSPLAGRAGTSVSSFGMGFAVASIIPSTGRYAPQHCSMTSAASRLLNSIEIPAQGVTLFRRAGPRDWTTRTFRPRGVDPHVGGG